MSEIIKIWFNRKPRYDVAWGGGNLFLMAVHRHARKNNFRIVESIETSDIVFIMDPRPNPEFPGIDIIRRYKNYKLIVHRINEIDSKRDKSIGVDPILREASRHSNLSIFVSRWMRDEHTRMGWHCKNKEVLINGVDLEIFKNYQNKRSKKTGKIHICVHHWSTNYGKDNGLHGWLDEFVKGKDDYEFTYIGRPTVKLYNSIVMEPLFGARLAQRISSQDVYINGSKNDPASNSLIEAVACGLPTYAPTWGGGSGEIVGEDHLWENFNDVEKLLLSKNFEKNTTKMKGWQQYCEEFFALLRKYYVGNV